MTRGNQPHSGEKNVQRSVQIPESLWKEIEADLGDPLTGRIRHGEFSRLITHLLRRYYRKEGGLA